MEITYKAPWWRFWDKTPRTEEYRGGGTIWRKYPSGESCGTNLTLLIEEVRYYRKFNNLDLDTGEPLDER